MRIRTIVVIGLMLGSVALLSATYAEAKPEIANVENSLPGTTEPLMADGGSQRCHDLRVLCEKEARDRADGCRHDNDVQLENRLSAAQEALAKCGSSQACIDDYNSEVQAAYAEHYYTEQQCNFDEAWDYSDCEGDEILCNRPHQQ
ncbi:MAG: hypothetical protein H6818_24095 [Phycisphaerales bacterium]|nr:hypothetical protein [Phycisphaerales bacterium]